MRLEQSQEEQKKLEIKSCSYGAEEVDRLGS